MPPTLRPEEWGRPHTQKHTTHPQTLRQTPGACSRPSPWDRRLQDSAPGWRPRCREVRRAPQDPCPAHTEVSPSLPAPTRVKRGCRQEWKKPRGGRRGRWIKSPLRDSRSKALGARIAWAPRIAQTEPRLRAKGWLAFRSRAGQVGRSQHPGSGASPQTVSTSARPKVPS